MTFPLASKHNSIIFACCFIALVLWQLPSILPPVSYEADSVSISMGVNDVFKNGWSALGETGYGYWMQPMTYIILAAIKFILPQVEPETIYSVISSLSAIGMQWVSILLASRIVAVNRFFILIAFALLPEWYAISSYPNSTAIAALAVFSGFYFLSSLRLLPAALLLTLAPLFRLDVIMIYPLIFLFCHYYGLDMKRAVILTAAFAFFLILFLIGFYAITGSSITHTLETFSYFSDIISIKKNLQAIYGFYGPVTLLAIPAGIILLVKQKNIYPIVLVTVAFLLVHGIQFRFGNASKHFALLIPFAGAISAVTAAKIAESTIFVKSVVSFITGLYLFAGVRISEPFGSFSQPLLNEYVPTLAHVDFKIGNRDFTSVIGGGQAGVTSDEVFLSSGSFFYPGYVNNIKKAIIRRRNNFIKTCAEEPAGRFIMVGWDDSSRGYYMESLGEIDGNKLFKDEEIESAIGKNPDSFPVRERIAEIIRRKYHPTDGRPVFLIFTESISHRYQFTLRLLKEDGFIEKTKYGDNIYKFLANRSF